MTKQPMFTKLEMCMNYSTGKKQGIQQERERILKIIKVWIKSYDWYDCHLERVDKLKEQIGDKKQ